ncbi:MAG: J domain-containing protein [Sandaracinaceae bacterium]|nr:J domain-containing protein [Sandaracinaceae bacterium]
MSEDLYAILGVSADATEDEIKRAYRKGARKHHPDVNPGDAGAEDRFKRLSGAYEILSNPEKRALYDELGADAEKIGYDPERAEEYRQWKRRADASAGFGGYGGSSDGSIPDLEELLGELFGRQARGPRRGQDVEASLEVSFEDAARGVRTSVGIDGKTLEIAIPAGIEPGQKLRLAGQGIPGRDGGPAGDLYVRIQVAAHPRFTRDGKDLSVAVPITVPEALVGATVEVPTLASPVKLKVPAGAQNGQRMRLRGKGIEPKGKPAGDLYVTLEIVMPKGGDDAARAAAAEAMVGLYEGQVIR